MTQIINRELLKVTSSAVTGTTCMTLFSYIVSETQEEKFKEPQLLAQLLGRLVPEINKQMSLVAGWSIHYSVGLAFAILYAKKWRAQEHKATIKSGLILGGFSGLLAVMVWRSVFKLHPAPPRISFKKFYGHILLAHFIFGAFASAGYNMIRSTEHDT